VARTARAKRYAQAVFQIAQQTGEYDKWLSDLETLGNLKKDDIYFKALASPALTYDDKARLLREHFAGISPMAVNLVSLLIERRILGILPGIWLEFQGLLDAYRGIERATVSTAVSLDDDERRQLEDRLGTITGKKVAVTATVNPSLIGGVVARFGGKLLDGSTRSKLEALKKEIGQIPR
jgi:F-type H+-transporting ATPase subunit delta